ncbi:urea ABC transporter permease subunit UrtB [Paracoccus versutus]|uniref:Amino acid/amide ABC transporter membrane protein 1 (HAAT family) n=1 Tax=Paracoccus versutus TaxID=34007 RepID=A0AAQ0KKP1_PARVE|nr:MULTISPECIES: urea ABC transporter permease subunit UrtB [Paracoccus]KGJ10377.1 branched-chain amino acid ABC transporter permease [Paracoccus versutus]MBT0778790.1 urea ABC transporter permease subunit UrtB [Paracoccus sp. pheM1]REG43898.1 amino acid/amide ABC transporter membrane protein 1 (HAAT family) [Paracoccus versutus]WEJ79569.1 urea ABC transporter permease subunit UrtB [Paracoccus versutus]
MTCRLIALLLTLLLALPAAANPALEAVVADNLDQIEKPSRRTVGPLVAEIAATGPEGLALLSAWAGRALGLAGGRLVIVDGDGATDAVTGQPVADAEPRMLRPNSGVRGVIESALVAGEIASPDRARRAAALASIARDGTAAHLAALRSAAPEADPVLAARRDRIERLLTIRFDTDPAARVAAIQLMAGDVGLDFRAALNPLLATRRLAAAEEPQANIARELRPGSDDFPREAAVALLTAEGLIQPRLTPADQRAALAAHVAQGRVGGVPVAELSDPQARDRAYEALEAAGAVPPAATESETEAALAGTRFFEVYAEADPDVTDAARAAQRGAEWRLAAMSGIDLGLDALSLASIYFLAAIGLAITFGVMRVINMAHGEFIMMGAYTGYVTQTMIADRTLSLVVALPLAFAVTFAAGVALYRLVIRHLAHRPLETLLATFGVSIALQQLAKNIFGTQARPLTAPAWLEGAITVNDVISISSIRVAILVLAVLFLGLFLFIMKRTRLGLEVRAVTQNPGMAASMGINPDRIAMMTFGLGSGIAGIAGVAIGLFAQVTSELGQQYIVQSFMTVVVGGVGNIWGTLAGAGLIGVLSKVIESFNPSNTLAAQTFMILFIVIFIQFRPRGIIPQRGRAAEA